MKLSVIVATKNRPSSVAKGLDSIAGAFAAAGYPEAEILVVDNASTDSTGEVINGWAKSNNAVSLRLLFEPVPGLSRSHNRALRAAKGELFAFIDDDCQVDKQYVNDLLRYHASDTEPVLRGGRVELGDPTDLPLTINTAPDRIQWNRRSKSARYQPIAGQILGCNMTMPRTIVHKLGPFDERLGPGASIPAGGDSDYLFRAYLAYFTLEYVPDMIVAHHHGRKSAAEGRKLLQQYLLGNGAELAKHGWKNPDFCRAFYWDARNALKEIIAGGKSTTSTPYFSHRDKVVYAIRGALRYLCFTPASRKEAWGADFQEPLDPADAAPEPLPTV